MDSFVLQAIATELDALLRGARVEKVSQPGPLTVHLHLEGPGRGSRRLLLSADPAHPRVHLTGERTPAPAEVPVFCRSLRKHLAGCKVARVAAGEWERVLQISFERARRGGEAFALMAEVMGRWSNLVLLDGRTGRIIDAVKSVSEGQSRERPLMRNQTYRLPPPQRKRRPADADEAVFEKVLRDGGAAGDAGAAAGIVRAVAGISPLAAEVIARRAGPEPGARRLWESFSEAVEAYRLRRFRPAVIRDAAGAPRGLSAIGFGGEETGRAVPYPSMNEAAEAFYAGAAERSAFASLKGSLSRTLQRAAKKVGRSLEAVGRDLLSAREADAVRRKGELLLENLARVAEKARTLRVRDGGRTVEIDLDPRLPPSANAQRYFRRYKKLKRLVAAGSARKRALEGERAFLEGLEFDLEEAESLADLGGVGEALAAAGYARAAGADGKKRKKGPSRSPARPWRRFLAPGGWEIFVGRSALGNEALLRRVGRAGDTWLHAQGMPGSHVLLRMPGGREAAEPPEEALGQAGALAAYFSRGRADSKVRVDHLPVGRLRRPRGARPGQVVFTGQRTLIASPEEGARLAAEWESTE